MLGEGWSPGHATEPSKSPGQGCGWHRGHRGRAIAGALARVSRHHAPCVGLAWRVALPCGAPRALPAQRVRGQQRGYTGL